MAQIVQFLCLTGQLPLTVLDSLSARGVDHSASMTRVVFSALFNLRLLHYHRTGLCFDVGEVTDENGEQGVLEGEEETVILNAVKSLLLANIWTKVESQVSACPLSEFDFFVYDTNIGDDKCQFVVHLK